jgi:hypothetical protein
MKRLIKFKSLLLGLCFVGNMFPMAPAARNGARSAAAAMRAARHGRRIRPRVVDPTPAVPVFTPFHVPVRFAHCHDVLDVPEKATKKEINTAYRTKSLEAHPDAGGSDEEFVALGDAKDEALARLNGTYSAPCSSSGSENYRYEQPPVEKTTFYQFKNLSKEAQKEQAFEFLKSYMEECNKLWENVWTRDKAHPNILEVKYFFDHASDEDKVKMSRLVIDHTFQVDRAYYEGFVLVPLLNLLPQEEAVQYAKRIIKAYFKNTNHLWDLSPMHACLDMLSEVERVEFCKEILEDFIRQGGATDKNEHGDLVFVLLKPLSNQDSQQYVKRIILQYLEKSADPELSYGWRLNKLAEIMRNLPDSLKGSVSLEIIKDYTDQGCFHTLHFDDLSALLYSATHFAPKEIATVMTQIVDDYIQREKFEQLDWYTCFGCLEHTPHPLGFGRPVLIDLENQRLLTKRIIETYLRNGRLSELFTPALVDCVKKCLLPEEQELFVPQILDYYSGVWSDDDYRNRNYEYSKLLEMVSDKSKQAHYRNLSKSKAYRFMHRWNPFK